MNLESSRAFFKLQIMFIAAPLQHHGMTVDQGSYTLLIPEELFILLSDNASE
jgi:hypothetical protein